MTIGEGDSLPDFTLPTDDRGEIGKANLAGKPFVLFLYPKDDTPGCTTESIGFTGRLADFRKLGVDVIGLSKDDLKKHAKFREKHALEVTLASDVEGDFIEALGSWVEKSMYGKAYMGIDRSTFLVDADGQVVRVWRKVKVPGHVDEVLEAARVHVS
ncbi:MAG: peroxiredoxin [Geminicoccaceae bacterium]|nr:peroxiredoxin [Geminicoccaceae bacterium]